MKRFFFLVIIIVVCVNAWPYVEQRLDQAENSSIIQTIKEDISSISGDDYIHAFISSFQSLLHKLENALDVQEEQPSPIDQPELGEPVHHIFSIHNIEIGDYKKDVELILGEPKRISYNEYGTNWYTYHEDFHHFLNVMYNEKEEVIGLYTNQDLVSSTNGIVLGSSKEEVLKQLGEPLSAIQKGFVLYRLQEDNDYHIFQVDGSFITIFYDQHEDDTVTAIQLIDEQTEKNKKEIYAVSTDELTEGFEFQMFDLTNATRVNHSLQTLTWDDHVSVTARKHSVDMAENHYFNHTNLQGQSPFDRMKEDQLFFVLAGENLAYGQFSSIFAHEGLMNSLGHRENILRADYEYLGVGVAFNEENHPYYTQNYYAK